MLTDRYRIVGLLGKGGMGEVYRADDLKLRQPVALKLLPKALADQPKRLERFHHEVRVARQVSHPNVCRVYDIGEASGQPFISMEYIDGEDLASVLRRMGRPAKDKSVQVARQLCAGLAAAHDKGVLHRDLKPHNVMVDGQGRVRVTDFGLAGFVQDFTGAEVGAGTPTYMAPEQLAGKGVSVKSDLYALGLVLYELFTGQRALTGKTREELRRQQSELPSTNLSSLANDLDPAVERVILRCLEIEPSARPSSALAVAAALPGGDPLAAALEAGETPDPAMVAAGGEVGGLRPAIAVPCLVVFLIGLVLVAVLRGKSQLIQRVSMPHPPEVLAAKAQEIVRQVGYTEVPTDTAQSLYKNDPYLEHIEKTDNSPTRWDRLVNRRPAAIHYWFLQSPRYLVPGQFLGGSGRVYRDDPRPDISGMVELELDPQGRLLYFRAVPPERDESIAPTSDTDWTELFAHAGLDPTRFKSTQPQWTPPVWADSRAAWEGTCADHPDLAFRVEAAAYHGRPVFFKLIWPWTRASQMEPESSSPGERAWNLIGVVLLLLVLISSALVARRHLRLGRGDRRGAGKLALFILAVSLAEWLFGADHVATFWELGMFITALGWSALQASVIWLLYIALEPYVRRRWPQAMISWARVVSGRFRDPLVGRDILVGGLIGVAMQMWVELGQWVAVWLGTGPPVPDFSGGSLLHVRRVIAAILVPLPGEVFFSLAVVFVLVLLRTILRKPWLAMAAMVLLLGTGGFLTNDNPIVGLWYLAWPIIVVLTLTRWGLLPLMISNFVGDLFYTFPFTLDLSTWYAGTSLFALALGIAVGVYGFHTALAGRSLFKDELLEA